MFCRTILTYFLILGTIAYSKKFSNRNISPSRILNTLLKRASNGNIIFTNDSDLSSIVNNHNFKSNRQKREIALIDEDFDNLPDAKHIWSDTTEPEDKPMSLIVTKQDMFSEEGSGSTQFQFSTTLLESTLKSTLTTSENLRTEKTLKTSSTSMTDGIMEGSGDYSSTSTTTADDWDITDTFTPQNCFNSTCDDKELAILPGFTETVPEDASLTLECSLSNPIHKDLLRWYRSNDSNSLLLETTEDNNQTKFVLSQAKIQDSGMYMCVRFSKDSCCHRKLDVTIYKRPNYKYHLLIVGLVATVSLFTCLLLGIYRKYKLRLYKEEGKISTPLNEFLL